MAEQAHQKRDGEADSVSTSQPSVDVGPKPVSTSERTLKKQREKRQRQMEGIVVVPFCTAFYSFTKGLFY